MSNIIIPPGNGSMMSPFQQVRPHLTGHAIFRRTSKTEENLKLQCHDLVGGMKEEIYLHKAWTDEIAERLHAVVPLRRDLMQHEAALREAITPQALGPFVPDIIGGLLAAKSTFKLFERFVYLDALTGILEFETELDPVSPAALASVAYENIITNKYVPDPAEIIPLLSPRQRQLTYAAHTLRQLADFRMDIDDRLLISGKYSEADLGLPKLPDTSMFGDDEVPF